MCGLFGYFSKREPLSAGNLLKALDLIEHRGPDGRGILEINNPLGVIHESPQVDSYNSVIAHQRLSILDVSNLSNQPFVNEENTLAMVFNGEIYNYLELRSELEDLGATFRSSGDTEVLLKAYEFWGDECFPRLRGMWAVILYDLRSGLLTVSRDRYGIKPFYKYNQNELLLLSSEIKPIQFLLDKVRVRPEALLNYFVNDVVSNTNNTFFKDVHEIPPGTIEKFRGTSLVSTERYYSIEASSKLEATPEILTDIKAKLIDSIMIHLRSDVGVGVALSGGLDSSALVGIAVKCFNKKPTCYSALYDGVSSFEASNVQQTCELFGLNLYKATTSASYLAENLEKIVLSQEEPFPSSSICAQYSVFEKAHEKGEKVVLSGQGADELFLGYYTLIADYLASLLRSRKYLSFFVEVVNSLKLSPVVSRQLALNLLPNRSALRVKHRIKCGYITDAFILDNSDHSVFPYEGLSVNKSLERAFSMTLKSLLRYEDRSSMAFSIESRVPFLDSELVDSVFLVDGDYKTTGKVNKVLLREIIKDYVHAGVLAQRKKIGFISPHVTWMQSLETSPGIRKLISDASWLKQANVVKSDMSLSQLSPVDRWKILNVELWARQFSVDI